MATSFLQQNCGDGSCSIIYLLQLMCSDGCICKTVRAERLSAHAQNATIPVVFCIPSCVRAKVGGAESSPWERSFFWRPVEAARTLKNRFWFLPVASVKKHEVPVARGYIGRRRGNLPYVGSITRGLGLWRVNGQLWLGVRGQSCSYIK